MPLSLRAKLAAMEPGPKKPLAPPPQSLYIKDTQYPLAGFSHWKAATGEILRAMDSGAYPSVINPRRILYLDTETTGLAHGAGTVAFLTGVGFLTEEGFNVRQFLMRDYSQEGQALRQLMALLPDFDLVVTYNGKSFDIPLLQSRLVMNRLDPACLTLPHADLLPIARRTFKMRLKHCRLSDVEAQIFHEPREGDLPGALVPQRYFDYLKTGDFSLLTDILEHNAQDIVSLCRLLGHLAHMYACPQAQPFPADVYAMGLALERRHETARARRCYRLASQDALTAPCQMRLGVLARREKDYAAALAHFQAMAQAKHQDITPYVEMAKIYEHRLGDIPAALDCTRRAILILAEPALMPNPAVQETQNALQYCYMRLQRKLQGKEAMYHELER